MADKTQGVELSIDDKLLRMVEQLDSYIVKIAGNSQTMGKEFQQAFSAAMSGHAASSLQNIDRGINKLNDSVDKLVQTFKGVDAATEAMAKSTVDAWNKAAESINKQNQGMKDTATSATAASGSVNNLTGSIANMSQVMGTGGVNMWKNELGQVVTEIGTLQARLDRLRESVKYAGQTRGKGEDEVSYPKLTKAEQDKRVQEIHLLEDSLNMLWARATGQMTEYWKTYRRQNQDAIQMEKDIARDKQEQSKVEIDNLRNVAKERKAQHEEHLKQLKESMVEALKSANVEKNAVGAYKQLYTRSLGLLQSTNFSNQSPLLAYSRESVQKALNELNAFISKGIQGGDRAGFQEGYKQLIQELKTYLTVLSQVSSEERKMTSENKRDQEALQAGQNKLNASLQQYNDLLAKNKGGHTTEYQQLKDARKQLEDVVNKGVQGHDRAAYKAEVDNAMAAYTTIEKRIIQLINQDNERTKIAAANAEARKKASEEEAEAIAKFMNRSKDSDKLLDRANALTQGGSVSQEIRTAADNLQKAKEDYERVVINGISSKKNGQKEEYDVEGFKSAIKQKTDILRMYEKDLKEALINEQKAFQTSPNRGFGDIMNVWNANGNSLNNIGALKKEITDINDLLNHARNGLTAVQQEQLKDVRASYEMQLKEAQKTVTGEIEEARKLAASKISEQERVAKSAKETSDKSAQSATQGKLREATASFDSADKQIKDYKAVESEAQKAYADLRQLINSASGRLSQSALSELIRQADELEKRLNQTTATMANVINAQTANSQKLANPVQYALDYSDKAKTYEDDKRAIELLTQAKLKFSDANGTEKKRWDEVNEAINRHKERLREAGFNTDQLREKQSKLMNIGGQLARQFALIFSVSQVEGYIGKMVQVRGEMELQQKSLRAIIQDKTTADQIFNQTVASALRSPFKIKELVTYTKQLAAYRVESDKLFDTTKRLADVSAGLGVDMQRLILAYGQVKAAAYLRGTEVRQFTEAGINLYGELQKYFAEEKGITMNTGQIVKAISERKVAFEDIERVFERLTDKGGIFYRMQEIQSETLNGKIGKLGDAIDTMYNDIGKSTEGLLKGTVDMAIVFTKNWQTVATVAKSIVAILALVKLSAIATGQKMSDIFSAGFAVKVRQASGAFATFGATLNSVKTAAINLGSSLKAIFTNNAYLIALMVLVQAIMDFAFAMRRANELMDEAIKEAGELRKPFIEIQNAYRELGSGFKGTEDELFEAKKAELNKLAELYKSAHLTLPVKVEEVKKEDIDAQFAKAEQRYAQYLKTTAALKAAFANREGQIEGWFGVFGDNLTTDTKDVTSAYQKVNDTYGKMEETLTSLYGVYDKLSENQKKWLKAANDVPEGDNVVDFLNKRYEYLMKIREEGGLGFGFDWGIATDFLIPKLHFDNAKKEFEHELDGLYDELKKKIGEKNLNTEDGKLTLKAAIETEAAEKQWDTWLIKIAEQFANKKFGIDIDIDENKVKEKANSAIDLVADAVKSANISLAVDVDVDTTAIENALDDLDKLGASFDKNNKRIKTLETGLKKMPFGLKKAQYTMQLAALKAKRDKDKQVMDFWGIESPQQTKDQRKKLQEQQRAQKKQQADAKRAAEEAKRRQIETIENRLRLINDIVAKYEELRRKSDAAAAMEKTLGLYSGDLKRQGISDQAKKALTEDVSGSIRDNAANIYRGIAQGLAGLDKGKFDDQMRKATDIQEKAALKILEDRFEDIKLKIGDMIEGVDLYNELRSFGLTGEEVKNLPIFKHLVNTAEDTIEQIKLEFAGLEGLDYEIARDKYIEQLRKKQHDEIVTEVKSVVEAYKKQLTEQEKLDEYYMKRRAAIYRKENILDSEGNVITTQDVFSKDLQERYSKDASKEYDKTLAKNTWNEFQKSGVYTMVFEDMQNVADGAIKVLMDDLQILTNKIKDMPIDQFRTITEQFKKLREERGNRNPFQGIVDGFQDVKAARKEIVDSTKEMYELAGANGYSDVLSVEEIHNQSLLNKLQLQKKIKAADEAGNKVSVQALQTQLKIEEKIFEATNKVLRSKTNLKTAIVKIGASAGKIGQKISQLGSAFKELDTDFTDEVSRVMEIMGSIGTATETIINSIDVVTTKTAEDVKKTMDVVNKSMAILAIIQAAWSIANQVINLFNSDEKKQKEIERIQRNVENLKDAYEKLEKAFDSAFDTSLLKEFKDGIETNLRAQISAYNQMIRVEQSKKKTDNDKIREWQKNIREISETLRELEEKMTVSLGGVGADNYKSAAEGFAEAWYDAFKQGESGIDALNEKFDEFFDNLVKKQILNRASMRFIEPLLRKIDQAVDENSEGGFDLTQNEIDEINAKKEENLEGYNAYVTALMDALGITPNGSELSALQKGISGVTEETASALEGIMESMRFYLATQQNDVREIRSLLERQYGTAEENPMLNELRNQTIILQGMSNAFFNGGNGHGIRAYIM